MREEIYVVEKSANDKRYLSKICDLFLRIGKYINIFGNLFQRIEKLFFCKALQTVSFAEIKYERLKMIEFCGIYLCDWPS